MSGGLANDELKSVSASYVSAVSVIDGRVNASYSDGRESVNAPDFAWMPHESGVAQL